jgi:hypothetical protein
MIDLHAVARTYLQPAISLSRREHQVDAPAIQAVHDKAETSRKDALGKWLQTYGVFQGLLSADRVGLASAVLNFADENECDLELSLPYDELIQKFDALHQKCRSVVQRDFTSFTSKALWCCYPNAVPLYDNFTQHSVWMISRLAGFSPKTEHKPMHRYGPFADVWLAMYNQVLPIIDQMDPQVYPYRVRVFDKILYLIGEPNYNRDPSKVRLAAGAAKS